jgi:hypothetical protein
MVVRRLRLGDELIERLVDLLRISTSATSYIA